MQQKKLKVLVWYWGRKGGGAKLTCDLCCALSKREDIELYESLCFENELFEKTNSFANKSFNLSIFPNPFRLMITVLALPLIRFRFKKFIVDNKIDVVYETMGHPFSNYIAKIFNKMNTFFIVSVHDVTNHIGEEKKTYKKETQAHIDMASCVMTYSDFSKQRLIDTYNVTPNKCTTLYLGAQRYNDDYMRVRDLSGKETVNLLFFGRIVAYKGLQIAIDAYKLLKKKYKNVRLIIAGSGDISSYQPDISNTPGIVLNNRWINEDETPKIFGEADIVLVPYIEASQSGIVATAIDMGVPSVVTPVGGIVQQIEDGITGVITKEVSAESVVEGIEQLIGNPLLYREMSKNCLSKAQKELSWDSFVDQFVGIIEEKN